MTRPPSEEPLTLEDSFAGKMLVAMDHAIVPARSWANMLAGDKFELEWLRLHLDGVVTYEHLIPFDPETQMVVTIKQLEENFVVESVTLNTHKKISYAVD